MPECSPGKQQMIQEPSKVVWHALRYRNSMSILYLQPSKKDVFGLYECGAAALVRSPFRRWPR